MEVRKVLLIIVQLEPIAHDRFILQHCNFINNDLPACQIHEFHFGLCLGLIVQNIKQIWDNARYMYTPVWVALDLLHMQNVFWVKNDGGFYSEYKAQNNQSLQWKKETLLCNVKGVAQSERTSSSASVGLLSSVAGLGPLSSMLLFGLSPNMLIHIISSRSRQPLEWKSSEVPTVRSTTRH